MDWRIANDGPKWMPVIRQVEVVLGLPKDLLCRMAFQESSFRTDVIDGTHVSPAGALGILQLMPQFFPSVHTQIPYSDDAVKEQITDAGQYIVRLYRQFGTWAEALAAYNFGPGNEKKFLSHRIDTMPKETLDYVADILADVPLAQTPGVPA